MIKSSIKKLTIKCERTRSLLVPVLAAFFLVALPAQALAIIALLAGVAALVKVLRA